MIKTILPSNGHYPFIFQLALKDKQGQIWLTTRTGLNMLKRNGNDIEHIGEADITTLVEDAQGKVWIGNVSSGVNILDTTTWLSRSFTEVEGLSSNKMEDFFEYNQKIFLSNEGGMDIIDSSRKTIEHIGKTQGLNTNGINGIIKDQYGMFWVTGNSGAGIDVLDLHENTIHHIGAAQGLDDSSLANTFQDNQGRIWFTTNHGGGIIDTKSNTIKYLNNLPGITVATHGKPLVEDQQGNMWMGTPLGIYIINEKTDSFKSFSTKEGLIDNRILSFNRHNDLRWNDDRIKHFKPSKFRR